MPQLCSILSVGDRGVGDGGGAAEDVELIVVDIGGGVGTDWYGRE